MPELKFYDVKAKKGFMSDKFRIETRRNPRTKRTTYFAVAIAPSGIESWRIVSKEFAQKHR